MLLAARIEELANLHPITASNFPYRHGAAAAALSSCCGNVTFPHNQLLPALLKCSTAFVMKDSTS